MNIIFMGTPEFAVECLDVLVKSNHNILAVVTSEDKPAGRGQKIKISENVHYYLIYLSINIYIYIEILNRAKTHLERRGRS